MDEQGNELRAFVREVMNSAINEDANPFACGGPIQDVISDVCIDATNLGSGLWVGLRDVNTMIDMAVSYAPDIMTALEAYRHEVGEDYIKHGDDGEVEFTGAGITDALALARQRYTSPDMQPITGKHPAADYLCEGLKMAVWWYAREYSDQLARRYGLDI